MQCVFYTTKGIQFRASENVDRSIFNNPDIVRADFEHMGNKISFNLIKDRRLIFYKQVEMNSPAQTTFCVGYQKTIGGRNLKHIIKFRSDGSIELEDK